MKQFKALFIHCQHKGIFPGNLDQKLCVYPIFLFTIHKRLIFIKIVKSLSKQFSLTV